MRYTLFLLLLLIFQESFSQSYVRYVSQTFGTPTGDGLSWATASDDLQAMMYDVPSGGTIKLEVGIYKPKAYPPGCVGCTYNRDYAFYANKDMTIVGGYLGGSATPMAYTENTILSGDIGVLGDNSDNCHHVVISKNRVYLEHLSVRYGNANVGGSIFIGGTEFLRANGAAAYFVGGSLNLEATILSNNDAANQGGAIFGKSIYLTINNTAVINNSANYGGGIYLMHDYFQEMKAKNSVIANNIANQGGAMYISDLRWDLPHFASYSYFKIQIESCTIFGNTASNSSVFYTANFADAKLVFINSVVYGNGSNIHNHGDAHIAADNSIIQETLITYPPIRSKTPDYINPSDLDGIDNVFFTDDDGLVPQVTGTAALAEIGAYLWNTTLCPSTSIVYVDINNPMPGNGSGWATAFNNLNHALNFARRCNNVQEIRVAQGTYNPDAFNWYPFEFSSQPELKSPTFIIRPGLEVYGGYPTGGGIRNPALNTTTLTGITRNLVAIWDPNTNALDSTILDGFTIKGAFARMHRRGREDDLFSRGAGINIRSNYVRISGNIIKENSALKASAIEVLGNHVVLSGNTFTDHTTSPSTYFLYTPKGSLIKVEGDSCAINYNIISNNLLGDSSIILDIQGSNHLIKGNDINNNPSEPIYLQSFRSNCSYNVIKNNYGNGIKILGDSCQVGYNTIENNYLHGIFAEEKIVVYPARFYQDGVTYELFETPRRTITTNNFTKIHDNIIRSNQQHGIYIQGENDADVYSNTITNNISIAVEGASSVWNNTISNNATAIFNDNGNIHHNVINDNGWGIEIKKGNVFNNYIIDNGRALTIGLGNVYNNTFVNNIENSCGGIVASNVFINHDSSELHIINNTFYGNRGSGTNGAGAIYVGSFKGDTVEISNNIFYQNLIGIFATIPGADYAYNKLFVDYPPIFKNNLLQLSAASYGGVTNNDLGTGSAHNIFSGIPTFTALSDFDGPDNVFMTRDDGLVLEELSVGLDGGFDPAIVTKTSIDMAGIPRRLGPHADMGAYEKLNCVTLDTIYVNKNHVHTTGGAGWRSAIQDLNVALWLAHECTNVSVINVSADVYTPTNNPYEMQASGKGIEKVSSDKTDRTFHLRSGLDMYGGFIVQSDTAKRDPAKNRTILSGQLSDTSVVHTVMVSYHKDYWPDPEDTTVLDGFIVTGGMANDLPTNKMTVNGNDMFKSQGGGITIYGGTNKVANCNIENNIASVGGGIFLNTDTTMVYQTTVKNNGAQRAAGICATSGKYKLISNTFFDNSADTIGGLSIKDGYNHIVNNVFYKNQSTLKSGGLYLDQGISKVINNTFFDNRSTEVGALFINGGIDSLSNNIFSRNKKNSMYDVVGSDYQHTGAALTIAFNNNSMQLNKESDYKIGTQNELGTSTANLFNINPIFYDTLDIDGEDNKFNTFDDGLRLLVGSPMINIGENSALPSYITTDIYGSPRIQKGIVELGAYEGANVRCPEGLFDTLFVDLSVTLSGNGSSWSQAFKTIDEAIFITHMCPFVKYICVAEGTYYPITKPYNMQHYRQGIEVETTDARDVAFHLRDGVVLLGGYKKGGTTRNINNYPTILDADVNQNNTGNAYHTCLMAASPFWTFRFDTTIIDGVTIQNAIADNKTNVLNVNGSDVVGSYGGGLYIAKGYNGLKNSKVEKNYSDYGGAGIYSYGAKSTSIQHSIINQNISGDGAGLWVKKCDAFNLGYNTISSNEAAVYGGGLFMDSTTNVLHHNIVKNNNAKFGAGYFLKGKYKVEDTDFLLNTTIANGKGGGIYTTKSHGIVNRCAFDGNNTDLHGGGIYTYLCDSIFIWNSVFHGNKATNPGSLGGAVYNDKNDFFEQINCTTFGNTANSGESIFTLSNNPLLKNNIYFDSNAISIATGAMTLTNSIVKGGHPLCTSCPGVLGDVDPIFFDDTDVDGADNIYKTEDDGLNVKVISPALDNGTSYRYMSHDITYRLRDWGYRDIGAYEYFKCPSYDTLYVDQQVTGGKGLDWANAVSEFSTALYVAQTCPDIEEIHVAKGNYFPLFKPFEMQGSQVGMELFTPSDMDKTFHVRAGLYVYGGYKNGGTNRDRDLFPSVLSGNISVGNDDARHTVLLGGDNGKWTGLPKITFDGFHITEGHSQTFGGLMINNNLLKYDVGAGIYADYPYIITLNDNVIQNNLGHGLYMTGGESVLSHNTIALNQGNDGGGAYLTNGFHTLVDNVITDNTSGQGGGLSIFQDSIIMKDNLIKKNETTYSWGGGIFASQSDLSWRNNTITANVSKYGGGAYIENCNINIDSNKISSNRGIAYGGGGMQIINSNGRFYKNTVTSNFASQNGGGLGIVGGPITIESNLFTKNKALLTGGGIVSGNSDLYAINNVFALDTAKSGAAIQTYYGFSEIHNNTFFKNESTSTGGAFASALGANDLINNIFYKNTKAGFDTIGADYYNDVFNESFNVFDYNLMQFDSLTYKSENNNVLYVSIDNLFDKDPQFEDEMNVAGTDLVFGNADDGLRLKTSSPCINVGNKTLIFDSIYFDAKHDARVMNYQIDLGAYETYRDPCISNVIYVDTNRVVGGTGDSWANAFHTLTEALYVAHFCPDVDSILIAEGTYYPDTKPYQMDATMKGQELITSDQRDLTFHIRQGLTLVGGYPGGGDESPSLGYKTKLVGRKPTSAYPSYHTVLIDTSAYWTGMKRKSSIDYCVISDGASAVEETADSLSVNGRWVYNANGAAVYINGADVAMKFNTMQNNDATRGGALYASKSSKVYLEDNHMNNNTAVSQGAGIYATEATLTMVKNVVMMNASISDELRGLVANACTILLNGNNVIEGAKTINGKVNVNGFNTIKQ